MRLDKFLVSSFWEELAPNVIQFPLPLLFLDHSPIMLDGSKGRWTRSYFRAENVWLSVMGFGNKCDNLSLSLAVMQWTEKPYQFLFLLRLVVSMLADDAFVFM